ncbi:hypothetical protein I317_02820 [Kwoniella heveanensis CBS 569]|nr:hypothetical protein I317_02820 [Kwoniella heveanensis CBS 569]
MQRVLIIGNQGIAVVVVISVFAGIWFYNRHRKRLPPKTRTNTRSIVAHNPLPSLSFSRPSTDPYAETELGSGVKYDSDLDQTPKASRYGFTRPVYTRQKSSSSDWDLRMDDSEADATGPYELRDEDRLYGGGGGFSGKGKGKERAWSKADVEVELPSQPDEAAIPLRTKSPRPGLSSIPSHHSKSSSRSMSSSSLTTSDKGGGNGKGMGGSGPLGQGRQHDTPTRTVSNINPFEHPYDETRLSPVPSHRNPRHHGQPHHPSSLRRHGSQSSFSSVESDIADEKEMRTRRSDAGHGIERGGSSGGDSTGTSDDDGRSVRVSQIREGSRFVERFESKESLA